MKFVSVAGFDVEQIVALVLCSAKAVEELNHVTVDLAVPPEVDGDEGQAIGGECLVINLNERMATKRKVEIAPSSYGTLEASRRVIIGS